MSFVIKENELNKETLLTNESIYSIGNGYVGVRGNFEEGYGDTFETIRGTYINAFYDIVPLQYVERAYGFPETMQKLLNVIDSQTITVKLENGEFVSALTGKISNYKRVLDMKNGFVCKSYTYHTEDDRSLHIKYTRLVSFKQRELFAINLEIEPVSYQGKITVESFVNGDVKNYEDPGDPRVGSGHAKLLEITKKEAGGRLAIMMQTKASGLSCACHSRLILKQSVSADIYQTNEYSHAVSESYTVDLTEKKEFTKYSIYTDTLRHKNAYEEGEQLVKTCSTVDFKTWREEQSKYLHNFWENANISVVGQNELEEGLRFNIFQLLQSIGTDKYSNIAAKGLSGEGYEGHYFWDTEIFIFPIFLLTMPEIAKKLLLYRYNILDSARARAKIMGHKQGALFPWRTISGEECSGYFPAGTAQYHISGDIAYAFISYYLATGDIEFMYEYGTEVIFETARLWMDVGHENDNTFYIDCVTGPDEYTAIVNNNYYTNAIAKYNLYWAYTIFQEIKKNYSADHVENLLQKIKSNEREIAEFLAISNKMFLPYDQKLDISPQDDSFLHKKKWDFQGTGKDKYPLLLHFHPLTLYRHQVLKQADTVLAHLLLEEYVEQSTIKNSYDYYEKISTHDSSLSASVYSMVACKIGCVEKAYDYFIETARLDLDNTHNNTKDGLHMANMGGTFMAMVYGFAGLRIKETGISMNPVCPSKWEGYSFAINYRERILSIKMYSEKVTVHLKGEPLKVKIYGEDYTISDILEITGVSM